jgi:ABC-2 type transport system permease protein
MKDDHASTRGSGRPAQEHSASPAVMRGMNWHGVRAIYQFEMARWGRTLLTSILSPVLSTMLYFVVFGAAIGSRIPEIGGVSYGAFIVPGLMMLLILTESIQNAAFGIYMPRFTGTFFEPLSAPISPVEMMLGYVGAAATKSTLLGTLVLATSSLFVPLHIAHPLAMAGFLVLTAITFSLFGFIIGIWADSWEQLQIIPLLIVTPLTFLGGTFYSLSMLPPFWQTVSLFNPVVYLISGFRWSFLGAADIPIGVSLGLILMFLAACIATVWWVFKTGYRIKV